VIQRIDAVAAMRADGDYTRVFVANGPPILVNQSLGKCEAQVPAPPFLRIHRSLIVNMDRLREIETIDRDTVRLRLDGCAEVFVVGRTTAARIRKLYPGLPRQRPAAAVDRHQL
jgi:two-component system LytT family response regulator